MKRRTFFKNSGLAAVAISSTGFVYFQNGAFVGDCQTTTDILGPFYRPNAPVRNNLVIDGMPGEKIILRGSIFEDDCKTVLEGAKIELWHCSADEVYDNDSEAFNYRGIAYSDHSGSYNFTTQMPVPYDAGGGMYRPAHFHLMISAPGYQNLITQLYFSGDDYLEKDPSSRSARAQQRILEVGQSREGILKVEFDVIMQKQLDIDLSVLDRLKGMYQDEQNAEKITEVFRHENQLWMKNEVFGESLKYLGDNTFVKPGRDDWGRYQITFEILENGGVRAIQTSIRDGKERVRTAVKI